MKKFFLVGLVVACFSSAHAAETLKYSDQFIRL